MAHNLRTLYCIKSGVWKDYYAQMQFTQTWLDVQDIQLVYVPYTQGISTTELKSRIMGKQIN